MAGTGTMSRLMNATSPLANGRLSRRRVFAGCRPPTAPLFALGLNYADHASELALSRQPSRWCLSKRRTPLTATTRVGAPDNVEYMHYEAELVVVIGKTARRVPADAHGLCCRLHRLQRLRHPRLSGKLLPPNLRVKSRDT
jgi:5-oxopent-3-ene-1,2,5-tricarboxylate decarboxylase/2-hydroxyhepta-2,4-diene-1,7-dioate isomerase